MRNDSLQLTHHLGMHACAQRATAATSTAAPLQPACGRGVPHKAQHTYQMRPPPTSRRCPQESAAPFSLCVLLQAPCVASGRGRSAAGPASRSPPVQVRHASPSHVNAPVAQWIRRLPTEQEIHGSIPCGGTSCFLLFSGWFQVSLGGSWFQGSLGRSCGASCMFRSCFLLFIVHSTSPLGTCRDRTATVNREFAVLLYWPSLHRATSTPRMQRILQRITLHRTAVLAKRTFNPNTRYRIG